MADDCIFCGIVAGEVPSRTVYEDDDVVAFLDANPLARGHTVVIPRDHHERIEDMTVELAGRLFEAVREVVPAVERAVGADAVNVGFNDGEVAGQVVPHVHGHVVPRFEGDGGRSFHAVAAGQVDLADEELDEVAEAIREAQ